MKWRFQLLPWALYTQFPKTARAKFLKCKSTSYCILVRILQNCSAKLCLTPGSLPGLIPYPSSYPLLCDSYTGPAEIQIKQSSLLPQTIFFLPFWNAFSLICTSFSCRSLQKTCPWLFYKKKKKKQHTWVCLYFLSSLDLSLQLLLLFEIAL